MGHFDFKGKASVQSYHLAVPHHELVACRKKSKLGKREKPTLHGNMIVHGDNLLALKALLPTHAGKVDVIYIDPPYNTGNSSWIYNDNVNSPMLREWLGNTVDREDMARHDKWCCMMWPRLRLLYELLSETGAIFVSIDDNEQHRLRMLLDEIFGEDNFVANVIWEKKYSPANDAKYFSDTHDFVVCYAKNLSKSGWKRHLLPRTEKANKSYCNDDNDGRGPWRSSDLSAKSYSENYAYPVKNPNTGKQHLPPPSRSWLFPEKKWPA